MLFKQNGCLHQTTWTTRVESASAAALSKADVNLAATAKTSLGLFGHKRIIDSPQLFLNTEASSIVVLLSNFPLVRLSTINYVAKESSKQAVEVRFRSSSSLFFRVARLTYIG